ncbi:1707_t:CDS:2 [Acaulospora colombiana]|uniref:1707_t:CDS:1 n=1 Tax=Acaulospora colombiana TaxID=27376 RepID=A0ACA9K0X2_9GLOM|nr:1707_t:CDS:2 [Acaulospora colombiana]
MNISEIVVSVANVSDSIVENLNNEVERTVTCDSTPSDNINKSPEDFNSVTQPYNSTASETSATNIPKFSHSDSNEISTQYETSKIGKKIGEPSIKQNHVGEISETLYPEKVTSGDNSSIDEASQHLAQLCDKAFDAEDRTNRANHMEILCWSLYGKDFRIQLNRIIENSRGTIGEKKVRSLLYDSITEQLNLLRKQRSQELGLQLRDISRDSLRKKTQKAEKVYKFFEKVGHDKIKYIKSYSATSISELTDEQIQEVIDYHSNLEESEIRSFALSPDDKKSYDGDTNDNGDFDVNQLLVENFFDDDSQNTEYLALVWNENALHLIGNWIFFSSITKSREIMHWIDRVSDCYEPESK